MWKSPAYYRVRRFFTLFAIPVGSEDQFIAGGKRRSSAHVVGCSEGCGRAAVIEVGELLSKLEHTLQNKNSYAGNIDLSSASLSTKQIFNPHKTDTISRL